MPRVLPVSVERLILYEPLRFVPNNVSISKVRVENVTNLQHERANYRPRCGLNERTALLEARPNGTNGLRVLETV